jgi:hypothetical protein
MKTGLLAGTVAAFALVLAAGAPPVLAKSGKTEVTYCGVSESEVISHSDKYTAISIYSVSAMRSVQPDALFDRMSGECRGIVGILNGEVFVKGYCQYTDADGDTKFGTFAEEPGMEKGVFVTLSGTGKYAGIVESVEYEQTSFPSNGSGKSPYCGSATGTYTLP